MDRAGMRLLNTVVHIDTIEQLQTLSAPKSTAQRGLDGLPTGSSQSLQRGTTEELRKQCQPGAGSTSHCSQCKDDACAVAAKLKQRHATNSILIPVHPTRHSQQACISTQYKSTALSTQSMTIVPPLASAAQPAVLEPHQYPAQHPEALSTNLAPKGDACTQLTQLQQLTSSLAEAVRVRDLPRMQLVLQLMSAVSVTGQSLFQSQAAVAVRQLLKQQRQHSVQDASDVQLQDSLVQTAQLLLKGWKAVLVAEVDAADIAKVQAARQALVAVAPGPAFATATPQLHPQQRSNPTRRQQALEQRKQQHSATAGADSSSGQVPALGKKRQRLQGPGDTAAADGPAAAAKRYKGDTHPGYQVKLPSKTTAAAGAAVGVVTAQKAAAAKPSRLLILPQQGLDAEAAASEVPFSWLPDSAAYSTGPLTPRTPQSQHVDHQRAAAGPRAKKSSRAHTANAAAPPSASTPVTLGHRATVGRTTRAAAKKSKPWISKTPASGTQAVAVSAGPTAAKRTVVAAGPAAGAAAANGAAIGLAGYPGPRVKLAVGTTKITPTGRSASPPEQQSPVVPPAPPAAAAATVTATATAASGAVGPAATGRGSAMWGAGAKALKAVKGPSHHHTHHGPSHGHAHQQHGRQHTLNQQQAGAGAASPPVSASHASAAVNHAFPPTRHVTVVKHNHAVVDVNDGAGRGDAGSAAAATVGSGTVSDAWKLQEQQQAQQQKQLPLWQVREPAPVPKPQSSRLPYNPGCVSTQLGPYMNNSLQPDVCARGHQLPAVSRQSEAWLLTKPAVTDAGVGTKHVGGYVGGFADGADAEAAAVGADDLLVDTRQQGYGLASMGGLVLSPAL